MSENIDLIEAVDTVTDIAKCAAKKLELTDRRVAQHLARDVKIEAVENLIYAL